MHIVFWQNIPSFHQSATIRALASMQDCKVTLALQEDLSESFQAGGWEIPDFGNARVLYPHDENEINNILEKAGGNAIHIFSGIRFPIVRRAFKNAIKKKAFVGVLSEAPDSRGVKGLARYVFYRAEMLRLRSKINFILAIGHMGAESYYKYGFPLKKIYPFGYFVEKPTKDSLVPCKDTREFRLVFVGQCIKRKGIDILLKALNGVRNQNWRLDVVGEGKERANLMRLASQYGLTEKIIFHGAMKNTEVQRRIVQSDFLILPSRWDGWGAVVNEALMLGVPVVCSDMCGAADLLREPFLGAVYKSGSIEELKIILEERIMQGKKTPEKAVRIKEWSKVIEGEVAAQYLRDVICAVLGTKPKPNRPWF